MKKNIIKQAEKNKLQEIDKIINNTKNRFVKYQKYLDDEFYKVVYKMLIDENDLNSINVDNVVMKKLSAVAKSGNIDLEIELIEDYLQKSKLIITKMGKGIINRKNLEEDIIIEAIKTYNGEKFFSVHMVECYKKLINQKIKCPTTSFSEEIDAYVKKNQVKLNKPTLLEKLFNSSYCLIEHDNDNDNFNKFIYLKYGFHNNVYFSLEDISSILKEDKEEIITRYKESLDLLKSFIDKEFEDTIGNLSKSKNVKKKCFKL